MRLDPNKTALLVIDMQDGFLDEASPMCIPTAKGTVPDCAAVQEKARGLGIGVYFVIRKYAADGSDVEFTRHDVWKQGGRPCSTESGPIGWAMPPEFQVKPGDTVLVKPRYSAFFRTNLDGILRRRGIDTVVVTGTTTPNCIRATVFDAISLDYNTVLLEDCCSSVTEEIQRVNMDCMARIGAVVADSTAFLNESIDLPVTVEQVRREIEKEC